MNDTITAPLVSIIVPAFNEEDLLQENLGQLCHYLSDPDRPYRWELIVINDGSNDRTGEIANRFAESNSHVRALHHPSNFGLGQALNFGFANTKGDYVITMDVDLSYDVHHIDQLVDMMEKKHAKIVLASPYMDGGTIRNVPWVRRCLSVLGNRFLRLFVKGHFSTLTSMVRAYDGPFIRSLDLRAVGMDVMPEILYKAMALRARIVEMPARLDWGNQIATGSSRKSSMRIVKHVMSTILSGFIFRPFLFFVVPGILVAAFSLHVNFWMFYHFFNAVGKVHPNGVEYTVSEAFADAYRQFPYTFIIGFLSLMLAIQLIGMGLISLQSKKYFEDLFHLGSSRLRDIRRPKE